MKSLKEIMTTLLIGFLVLSLPITTLADSGSVEGEKVIDELWGIPTLAYGHSLTPAQHDEVVRLLGLEGVEFHEVSVSGEDMVRLLGRGNPNAAMLSSASIKYNTNEEGGVTVEIVTPNNITSVSQNQYVNALITAGAEDVEVRVASPLTVTGHSALTGIYKAYEDSGEELDQDRMVVAQDELTLTTEISERNKDNEKFNSELLNNTMVDIKKEISKQVGKGKGITEEEATKIIQKEIKKNNLDSFITDDNIEKLVKFATDYAGTGAAISDTVLDQLDTLKEDTLSKAKEFAESIGESIDTGGFIESVKSFFNKIFSFIGGLFSSDKPDEVDTTELDNSNEPEDTQTEVIDETDNEIHLQDNNQEEVNYEEQESLFNDEPANNRDADEDVVDEGLIEEVEDEVQHEDKVNPEHQNLEEAELEQEND